MNTYFNWFKNLINIFIELILFFSIVATLYVFTSVFSGFTKILVFVLLVLAYLAIVYFFKNKLKDILNKLINKLKTIDIKTMILIISIVMIILKIIFTIFYNYDATKDGDIGIYADIANKIIETGNLQSGEISHLLGMGLHLAIFKLFKLPIHIGMFTIFFIGTIINFISFKNIIGKEKAFMAIMAYILMPSSILLTFCPTHEVFLYMYISISIFSLNIIIKTENKIKKIISSFILCISIILSCLVNPSGYILFVILVLIIALSNVELKKKIIVSLVLVLSLLGTRIVDNRINSDKFATDFNTYAILIHGSNYKSLGEQVDSYPTREMDKYLKDNGLDTNKENVIFAEKMVLINQYKYLFSHPIVLGKLIAHKFYILWSGNHYSVEMANNFNVLNNVEYYFFLCLSTLIYLTILSIGLVYSKRKNDEIFISNYKLVIIGCFCITMLSVVLNKYSLYVTLFIYLVSFYKIDIDEKD